MENYGPLHLSMHAFEKDMKERERKYCQDVLVLHAQVKGYNMMECLKQTNIIFMQKK